MAQAKGKAGTVIFSPHIHSPFSVEQIMWDVVIALLPAVAASIIFFGFQSVRILLISLVTALVTELIMNLFTKSRITILDGSAVITAILFAFNLPPAAPWYLVAVGAFFAIAIVKWAFGGLGYNFMNPALGGRIFVLAAWPGIMINHWSPTIQQGLGKGLDFMGASQAIAAPDAVTSATALSVMKEGGWQAVQTAGLDNYWNLFIGNVPGCIGETSALALLIGAAYLFIKRVITPEVPFIYVGTVALLSWIFGGLPHGGGLFTGNALFHVLSGGLILGAFFMANDMVTSPISLKGNIIYAVLLGILTVLIRLVGGYPEGVSYAIVIMNIFVPLIDRFTRGRIYGKGLKVKKEGGKA